MSDSISSASPASTPASSQPAPDFGRPNAETQRPIRVLSLIDTTAIGGPGVGLFQTIANAPAGQLEYELGTFKYAPPRSSEFIDEARKRGYPITVLEERWRFDPKSFKTIRELWESRRFDVVESHGYKTHVLALYLARRFGAPWLAVTHGWTRENKRVFWYQLLERWLLKFPKTVLTVAPTMFQEISKLRGSRRTVMLMNAVDTSILRASQTRDQVRRHLGVGPDEILVGCIGRLSREKGHRHLLDAVAKIQPKCRNGRFVIVGEGAEYDALQARAKQKSLTDLISFRPYTSTILDYYRAIDLLVLPSLSEGLPFVLLEAMACDVPAIATDVGAVREVIEHEKSGWIVPPADVDALADTLLKVLTNPTDLAAKQATAKQSLFPKFDPKHRVQRLQDRYVELISES